jgi:hypothetical protein
MVVPPTRFSALVMLDGSPRVSGTAGGIRRSICAGPRHACARRRASGWKEVAGARAASFPVADTARTQVAGQNTGVRPVTPNYLVELVPLAGLEPARCFHHLILSQARLPIPPQGLAGRDHSHGGQGVNGPIPKPSFHRYMGGNDGDDRTAK